VVFTELAHAHAAKDYATFMRLLRRFSALVAVGSLAVWTVAAVLAEPMLRLFAGAEFVAAASAFRWYLFAMVLLIANAPFLRALIALGRPGTLFVFECVTLGILAVCLIAFANLWGLVGVSIAVVVHRTLQIAWSAWVVTRVVRELS